MTAHLAHIFRHPIKSIGYEEIRTASLEEGRVLPFDRVWGVSTEESGFDGALDAWAAKRNFLRGAAAPGLMAVQAHLGDDGFLDLTHPDLPDLRIDPDLTEDHARLIAWLAPLWPANRPAPRAVEHPGVALCDVPDPYVSILSLSSLAALGDHAGQPMSPHRFRGNLWVEGWQPWVERDLVGRTLRLGDVELTVAEPIGRCRATCGNPETGREDYNTLGALKALNGDTAFGLYATVVRGGVIARGAVVEVL